MSLGVRSNGREPSCICTNLFRLPTSAPGSAAALFGCPSALAVADARCFRTAQAARKKIERVNRALGSHQTPCAEKTMTSRRIKPPSNTNAAAVVMLRSPSLACASRAPRESTCQPR